MPKAKNIKMPKLPSRHAKGRIIPVRVNAEDLKLFEKVAKEGGYKTLSSWIHETLLTGAFRKTL